MVEENVSDPPADDVNRNIDDHASDIDDANKANVLDEIPSVAVSHVHDSSLKGGEIDMPIVAGSK